MTRRLALAAIALAVAIAGCDGSSSHQAANTTVAKRAKHAKRHRRGHHHGFKVPRLLQKNNVYAADFANKLSPVVRHDRPLIYVPNSLSNTVDEIDPRTFKKVRHFKVGALPQHVVPSYDLKTLWVNNDKGNSLTPINPRNGKPGKPVHVLDPYNLYFTPDGRFGIVMAEAYERIDFVDAHSMKLRHTLPVPSCPGVNHADFSRNGKLMLVSCEFSGRMILVDVPHQKLLKTITLKPGAAPQDVKLSPDGRVYYVADMISNGVWKISAKTYKPIGFIPTGLGAHGLYVSRDARYLYVSNRRDSSISLISLKTRKVAKKWVIPGGATPDMGGVSTNGKVLWLTGRYSSEVYAINTRNGHLIKRIKVGLGPHGLCVYPQPGRYSLGHTGVFR
jgi:DNA-binding beta-propeller fold protein YncE